METGVNDAARGVARVPWWGVGLVAIVAAIGVAGFALAVRQPTASGAPAVIRLPAPSASVGHLGSPTSSTGLSGEKGSTTTRVAPQSTVVVANRTVVTEVAGEVATTLPPSQPSTTVAPSTSTTTTTHEDGHGTTTTEPNDHLKTAQ